jgi:hypothetical protein
MAHLNENGPDLEGLSRTQNNKRESINTGNHPAADAFILPTTPDRCSADDCDREVSGRGLCSLHYQRARKQGELPALKSRPTLEQRFWTKVDKTHSCWLWLGSKGTNGYGQFAKDGVMKRAHRVAWELLIGPITPGRVLDHRCHVRHCVNPAHLQEVTVAENGFRRKGAVSGSSSRWRGVSWDARRGKWGARVMRHGRDIHLGYFLNELDAARAAAEKIAELGDPKALNDLTKFLQVHVPGEQGTLFSEADV